ncbi:MAG: cob(I)yrinic acid a,c-diamide adenosyltransferase [Dorea sp.]|jgi:cob(I)alamin adenosyltransferase|uniref:cob(I)yrinic acid a,c-diamide adenosyltransferase n=1 Tax=Sporofaciens sp. JLR.KK001 TaxID=3112621 RepID=UPI002173388E|nr:cob(I)yrinic acid a,c-diamide adenosyltransferase [Dorea sp.]MCI9619320.1 cob(I)yrinic acid a,c-diamide adenosyltransferase [Dorea sp.]
MTGTGRIHIYYGDGKGKTTAAVGLAVRAAGSGLKVLFFQFLKDNSSNERKILEALPGVTCLPGREPVKFVSKMNGDERIEFRHYNNKALDEIIKFCGPFDMLILDEALCALNLEVLSEEKLISFIQHKPRGLEIVMTGPRLPDNLLEMADYVTEVRKVKHQFDLGRSARKGIEF